MRKTVSLVLAICGTLLLLLLFATGRLIYTHVYSQDFFRHRGNRTAIHHHPYRE